MNRQVWGSLTSSYREMLLFHELGHCLLNRSHQGNDFYNPTSIMNASLFSDLNYKTNYDYFIKELFHVIFLVVNFLSRKTMLYGLFDHGQLSGYLVYMKVFTFSSEHRVLQNCLPLKSLFLKSWDLN
jgi:hypothetical protein